MEHAQRGFEWDLNDWKWDGDLFIATPSDHLQFIPLVAGNSPNTSSSCSDEVHFNNGRRELERKRRVIVIEEDSTDPNDAAAAAAGAASLALKLGRTASANCQPTNTKLSSSSSTRAVCQVQDCGADLTKAKDYHRRHKVCEMHSKATKALVANLMQRFCQQCSRFHVLQEFDEDKRSCRRRLAGHNKRRRKTQPDATAHGNSPNEEQAKSVLLVSFLRILSNMHANNRSDQAADQAVVTQLLRTLGNPSGLHAGKGIIGLLDESQKLLNGENQGKGVRGVDSRGGEMQTASSQKPEIMFPVKDSPLAYSESNAGKMKLNNFDLNDIYVDSDDRMDDLERSLVDANFATSSPDFPSWGRHDSHQSSPPQTSCNSDSASAPSPSSSSGEAQSRTDRIVFKLFGKEPSDFPIILRGQILDWLAHSPTEIESYIRPGCIILTIYLRLTESVWEELCSDLSSCLARLFEVPDDTFWRTGWVYVRVQNQIAFVYNGQVIVDTSLPLQSRNCSRIWSVVPVAVSIAEQAHFQIRGSNLSRSATRLLCALEGKYLNEKATPDVKEDSDILEEADVGIEQATLSCSIPSVTGRGFIEVEDEGLSSSFFPFIVAEKDVCSEIRTLERLLEVKEADEDACGMNEKSEVRREAMDFINEMGWLLHRNQLRCRLGDLDPNGVMFSFRRYKWLMDFSMDHDWCMVVKKLLDILVAGSVGMVGSGGEQSSSSLKGAVSEMGMVHRAVRRNCRSMVELLLRYAPEAEVLGDGDGVGLLFRPDAQGPGGLTPLHVAAGRDGSQDVLDALTDDPGQVGMEAWKSARDSTGATPEDYARLRGHYGYIHLVQRKINNRRSASTSTGGHVVVDIPAAGAGARLPKQDVSATATATATASFEIGRNSSRLLKQSCKMCDEKTTAFYGGGRGVGRGSVVYRPAMLSMVAIAAVCVCMALMFRGMPNVVCLFRPFRWEMLHYGSS